MRLFIVVLSVLFYLPGLYAQKDLTGDELVKRADAFKAEAKTDSAVVYYEKASASFRENAEANKFIYASNQLGVILTRKDEPEKALGILQEAYEKAKMINDTNNLETARTFINLGVAYNALENYPASLSFHRKALELRLKLLGKYDADVATSYGNIGNVYRNAGEYGKSIEAHLKALKIRKKVYGKESVQIIESYNGLARAYREKKEYRTALRYFKSALDNKIKQVGEGGKELKTYYKNISDTYYQLNDHVNGDLYKQKAEAVKKT